MKSLGFFCLFYCLCHSPATSNTRGATQLFRRQNLRSPGGGSGGGLLLLLLLELEQLLLELGREDLLLRNKLLLGNLLLNELRLRNLLRDKLLLRNLLSD